MLFEAPEKCKFVKAPLISGQSYKQFTIVIYDSRVVIWGNFKSNTTLESLTTIVGAL